MLTYLRIYKLFRSRGVIKFYEITLLLRRNIFVPFLLRFSRDYFDISGQHIFRRNAGFAKINMSPFYFSFLVKSYQTRFLLCLSIYLSSTIAQRTMRCPICIKLIGSLARRACASKIYHANITQTRCIATREISFSLLPSRPFCTLLVVPWISRRENAGAHIKHAVIPLNLPAPGINRPDDSDYTERSLSRREEK